MLVMGVSTAHREASLRMWIENIAVRREACVPRETACAGAVAERADSGPAWELDRVSHFVVWYSGYGSDRVWQSDGVGMMDDQALADQWHLPSSHGWIGHTMHGQGLKAREHICEMESFEVRE